MTEAELLENVKRALNITGTYQDDTLMVYIKDVKYYMADAGVREDLINSETSVGVIARGVSDLWNYGNGSTTFSEYFMQRVIQLVARTVVESE
jgi:hypothetical protein